MDGVCVMEIVRIVEPDEDANHSECCHCGAGIRRLIHLNGTQTWVHIEGLLATCRGVDGHYLYPVKLAEPTYWEVAE